MLYAVDSRNCKNNTEKVYHRNFSLDLAIVIDLAIAYGRKMFYISSAK